MEDNMEHSGISLKRHMRLRRSLSRTRRNPGIRSIARQTAFDLKNDNIIAQILGNTFRVINQRK